MSKTWCVYSKRVAIELRKLGFKIIKTEPNIMYPQYDMYIFDNTHEFQKALSALTR